MKLQSSSQVHLQFHVQAPFERPVHQHVLPNKSPQSRKTSLYPVHAKTNQIRRQMHQIPPPLHERNVRIVQGSRPMIYV